MKSKQETIKKWSFITNKDIQGSTRDGFYEYAGYIAEAKLDSIAKALVRFYAFHYNWKAQRRSFWSEERICASIEMSRSTYQTKRKYLEELGWLNVCKVGPRTPMMVKPLKGRDDPEYEKRDWAKWQRSNKPTLDLNELASMDDVDLDLMTTNTPFEQEEIDTVKRIFWFGENEEPPDETSTSSAVDDW